MRPNRDASTSPNKSPNTESPGLSPCPSKPSCFPQSNSSQASQPQHLYQVSTCIQHLSTKIPHATKKKRIRFNHAKDYLLLQAVSSARAHVAPHGETGKRFEESARIFVEAAGSALYDVYLPSMKAIRDRFVTIIDKRKADVKRSATASGIVEERGAKEVLMDDMILEMDEESEKKRGEDAERPEKERKLIEAGEQIRKKALSRMSGQGQEDKDGDTEESAVVEQTESLGVNSASARKPRRRRGAICLDYDTEERECFIAEMNRRKNCSDKRFKIEEERLQLDRIRCEREEARQDLDERRVAVEEKRLELDVRKYELEVQERKAAVEERKSMVEVLTALAENLQ